MSEVSEVSQPKPEDQVETKVDQENSQQPEQGLSDKKEGRVKNLFRRVGKFFGRKAATATMAGVVGAASIGGAASAKESSIEDTHKPPAATSVESPQEEQQTSQDTAQDSSRAEYVVGPASIPGQTETSSIVVEHQEKKVEDTDVLWKKYATPTDHREWYAYDTSGSERNELREHTIKNGEALTIIMSNPEWSSQSGLEPEEKYVPDVAKEGKLAYSFSLPGAENQNHSIIVMADTKGRIHLDPNDNNPDHKLRLASGETVQVGEFSRLVLNPEAYRDLPDGDIATEVNDLQESFSLSKDGKFGTLSAGQVVDRDGKKVWQSFATIFGTDEAPQNITTTTTTTTEIPGTFKNIPVEEDTPKDTPDIPVITTDIPPAVMPETPFVGIADIHTDEQQQSKIPVPKKIGETQRGAFDAAQRVIQPREHNFGKNPNNSAASPRGKQETRRGGKRG